MIIIQLLPTSGTILLRHLPRLPGVIYYCDACPTRPLTSVYELTDRSCPMAGIVCHVATVLVNTLYGQGTLAPCTGFLLNYSKIPSGKLLRDTHSVIESIDKHYYNSLLEFECS